MSIYRLYISSLSLSMSLSIFILVIYIYPSITTSIYHHHCHHLLISICHLHLSIISLSVYHPSVSIYLHNCQSWGLAILFKIYRAGPHVRRGRLALVGRSWHCSPQAEYLPARDTSVLPLKPFN